MFFFFSGTTFSKLESSKVENIFVKNVFHFEASTVQLVSLMPCPLLLKLQLAKHLDDGGGVDANDDDDDDDGDAGGGKKVASVDGDENRLPGEMSALR